MLHALINRRLGVVVPVTVIYVITGGVRLCNGVMWKSGLVWVEEWILVWSGMDGWLCVSVCVHGCMWVRECESRWILWVWRMGKGRCECVWVWSGAVLVSECVCMCVCMCVCVPRSCADGSVPKAMKYCWLYRFHYSASIMTQPIMSYTRPCKQMESV